MGPGHTLAGIFTAWSGPSIGALATLIVSFSVVGALIASHRPENPIGWIFLAVGFFQGLLSAGDQYAVYALLTDPGALPLGAEAAWLGQWIWAPGLVLILVFLPLLFPDGHPPSRRWRPVAWLGDLSIGLTVVSSTIGLWPERGPALVTGDENPSHVVNVLVGFIAVPMLFVAGVGAVISLFVRFRRTRGHERQQIKWFASAAALTLVWITVFGQYSPRVLPEAIVALSFLLVIPSIPIALRHRPDHKPHPRPRFAYGHTGRTLLRRYRGAEGVRLTHRPAVHPRSRGLNSSLAALFVPLRRRIQSFIDRRFYNARKTLETFSLKLRDETDLEALNSELVGVVRETMQPAHVSLWLRPATAPNEQPE